MNTMFMIIKMIHLASYSYHLKKKIRPYNKKVNMEQIFNNILKRNDFRNLENPNDICVV